MHAYLVVGVNSDEKIKSLIVETEAKKAIDFSIEKIEMVRDMGKFLRLTQSEKTAIVVKDADLASVESQNAFLKNLEEPQKNIVFILTAKNDSQVLPTILSRCQVIRVKSTKYRFKNEGTINFRSLAIGEKLQIISNIKKREEALAFLEDFIHSEHTLITEKNTDLPHTANNLKVAQNTHKNLAANGNVTLQLTNFVVKLDTINLNKNGS